MFLRHFVGWMPRSELISWVSPFEVVEVPIFLAFDNALIDMLRNRVHDAMLAVRIGIGANLQKTMSHTRWAAVLTGIMRGH